MATQSRNLSERTYQLIREFSQRRLDLIRTDLDVARTFIRIARNSTDPETIFRDRRNARRAYDAMVHLLSTADVQSTDRQSLDQDLAALKSALIELGEIFPA